MDEVPSCCPIVTDPLVSFEDAQLEQANKQILNKDDDTPVNISV